MNQTRRLVYEREWRKYLSAPIILLGIMLVLNIFTDAIVTLLPPSEKVTITQEEYSVALSPGDVLRVRMAPSGECQTVTGWVKDFSPFNVKMNGTWLPAQRYSSLNYAREITGDSLIMTDSRIVTVETKCIGGVIIERWRVPTSVLHVLLFILACTVVGVAWGISLVPSLKFEDVSPG